MWKYGKENSRYKEQQVQSPELGEWLVRWRKHKEASVAGAAYLKEWPVGNKGGELARQDCIGDGKDLGFYVKCDGTIARHYLVYDLRGSHLGTIWSKDYRMREGM